MSPGLGELNLNEKRRGEKKPNLEPVRIIQDAENLLSDDPDTVDDDSNEFSVQLESFIALVAGCMSVIMELLWRFDLGFETSDYISGKLLAGRGMQSHDYKLFSFAPWWGMLRGSCHFSIAPLYRFFEGFWLPLEGSIHTNIGAFHSKPV